MYVDVSELRAYKLFKEMAQVSFLSQFEAIVAQECVYVIPSMGSRLGGRVAMTDNDVSACCHP